MLSIKQLRKIFLYNLTLQYGTESVLYFNEDKIPLLKLGILKNEINSSHFITKEDGKSIFSYHHGPRLSYRNKDLDSILNTNKIFEGFGFGENVINVDFCRELFINFHHEKFFKMINASFNQGFGGKKDANDYKRIKNLFGEFLKNKVNLYILFGIVFFGEYFKKKNLQNVGLEYNLRIVKYIYSHNIKKISGLFLFQGISKKIFLIKEIMKVVNKKSLQERRKFITDNILFFVSFQLVIDIIQKKIKDKNMDYERGKKFVLELETLEQYGEKEYFQKLKKKRFRKYGIDCDLLKKEKEYFQEIKSILLKKFEINTTN